MFKKIDFKEYKYIRGLLITGIESFREKVYKDSKEIATIGIGINIGQYDIWIKLILFYKFGLVKNSDDIPLRQFDSKVSFKHIIKDTQSNKFKEYETLIDKIAQDIKKQVTIDTKTSLLNEIIATHIKNYINQTQQLQRTIKDSPNHTIQNKPNNNQSNTESKQAIRLTYNDLKIDTTDSNHPKYIEFQLTKKEAQELFDIMIINYEAMTLSRLNKLNIHIFDKMKENKKEDRQYYREFIPFVSVIYQAPNAINNNSTLLQSAFMLQSRFLIWAIMRYDLGSNPRRRVLQSALFNLNNTKNKEFDNNHTISLDKENDENKFETFKSIFKTLNLIHIITPHTKDNNQSCLEYFRELEVKRDKTMIKAIDGEKGAYKNRNLDNKKTKNITNPAYAIYRSGYINPNELQSFIDILNSYIEYIDEKIPSALFEDRIIFKKAKLIDSNHKESEVRFKLENIFVIDKYNQNKMQESINAYTNSHTNKENILVIADKLDKELSFKQPSNTFLYLLTAKGNTIDATLFNDFKQESTIENDMCELFYYEEENNQIHITTLSNENNTIELDSIYRNKCSVNNNDIIYLYDNSSISITKNNENIAIINNYKLNLKYKEHKV